MTLSPAYRLFSRNLFAITLAALLAFAFTTSARAQDHLVTPQALQHQVQTKAATRQQNIDTVTQFLSTPIAEHAMKSQHFDAVKVRTAIPTLSDSELADLASRTQNAQQQFAAGFIGTGMLLVLIIAIVVIIVVVAVH